MINIEDIRFKTVGDMTDEERIVLLFALNDQALQTIDQIHDIFEGITGRIDALEKRLDLLITCTLPYKI